MKAKIESKHRKTHMNQLTSTNTTNDLATNTTITNDTKEHDNSILTPIHIRSSSLMSSCISLSNAVTPVQTPKNNSPSQPLNLVETKLENQSESTIETKQQDYQDNLLPSIILDKLDNKTKEWLQKLSTDEIASVLSAISKIPNFIISMRSKSDINEFSASKTNGLGESKTNELGESGTDDISPRQPVKTTKRKTKAADIGRQGELEFAEICKSLPENYRLLNTTKQGKCADFILVYKNGATSKRCLIEIKKYSNTVPKKEIDKFHEDIEHSACDAGLIISYNSKFAGIDDNVTIDDKTTSTGEIPIMYLANISDKTMILQCIKILMFKISMRNQQDIQLSKIHYIINTINSCMSQSAATRRILNEMQIDITKQIQRCQEYLISNELQLKKSMTEVDLVISESSKTNKSTVLGKSEQFNDRSNTLSNQATPITIPTLQEREDNIDEPGLDCKKIDSNKINEKKEHNSEISVCSAHISVVSATQSDQYSEYNEDLQNDHITLSKNKSAKLRRPGPGKIKKETVKKETAKPVIKKAPVASKRAILVKKETVKKAGLVKKKNNKVYEDTNEDQNSCEEDTCDEDLCICPISSDTTSIADNKKLILSCAKSKVQRRIIHCNDVLSAELDNYFHVVSVDNPENYSNSEDAEPDDELVCSYIKHLVHCYKYEYEVRHAHCPYSFEISVNGFYIYEKNTLLFWCGVLGSKPYAYVKTSHQYFESSTKKTYNCSDRYLHVSTSDDSENIVIGPFDIIMFRAAMNREI